MEEQRRSQIVVHGPMLYVDSPYHCIEEAEQGWEKLSAMIFLKSRERDYAAQNEYRFVHKVEEKVYPGGSSRAGDVGPEVYVELLARSGWPRKRED